jgi:hypothetical protein
MTLSVSWEPAALTTGTAIMLPEEGPHARPALASGAERLGIRPGGTVLTIVQTYHTADHPVETADIVIPV